MKSDRTAVALFTMGAVVGIGVGYRRLVAPRVRTWGATDEEARRPMPGDEIVPNPSFRGTHAVTIRADPSVIWPWLVQIGYGRAGFYTYAALERLMGLDIKNADRVVPELQHLKVGDRVALGPSEEGELPVAAIEPERNLCLGGAVPMGPVAWSFGLYPEGEGRTRLVSRNQGFFASWTYRSILRHPGSVRSQLPMRMFVDLGVLLMVRRMLLGIKRRAELHPLESARAAPAGAGQPSPAQWS